METNNYLFNDHFNFATVEPEEVEDNAGLKCELKTYEARYNSQGKRIILNVGTRKELDPPSEKTHESALVLTRFYDKEKDLEYTELAINSPHIKAALRKVVSEYPGVNLQTKEIVIRDAQKCFFHYRKELQAYGSNLDNAVAIQHLLFALEYMYKTLQNELYSYYIFVETPSLAPSLDFPNLWMAFRPGDLIYTQTYNVKRVLRFKKMERCSCTLPWCPKSRWLLYAEFIDYDGTNFGFVNDLYYIYPYDNYKPFEELKVFPLRYHSNKEAIIEDMLARGRKFVSLHGVHHREYEGIAEALASSRRCSLLGEEDEFPLQSTLIKGRIMIDGKTFALARPSHERFFSPSSNVIRTETEDHLHLSNDELLICHHQITGFSLVDKRWCFFEVELIRDVNYNLNAFETLLLPAEQKQMLHSLVKLHAAKRLTFDDIIKGKGKGMIFLLHGVPGVGKTLTAESVAEFAQRPLYTMTAGDLGDEAASVERNLSDAFRLATTWNAIVLIDEADVFLEQRSANDLERNCLVSVFLRILEYYEGIMILTTNRIGSFDTAFTSRIHLAIKYHHLSPPSRRELWRTFLLKASPHARLDWIDNSSLDELAMEELNGRQIKNIVRTAHALAVGNDNNLNLAHINMALKGMKTFETDFAEEKAKRRMENDSHSTDHHASKRRRVN